MGSDNPQCIAMLLSCGDEEIPTGEVRCGQAGPREVNRGRRTDTLEPVPIGHSIEFSLRAGL